MYETTHYYRRYLLRTEETSAHEFACVLPASSKDKSYDTIEQILDEAEYHAMREVSLFTLPRETQQALLDGNVHKLVVPITKSKYQELSDTFNDNLFDVDVVDLIEDIFN